MRVMRAEDSERGKRRKVKWEEDDEWRAGV